jgi:hypothetical protein
MGDGWPSSSRQDGADCVLFLVRSTWNREEPLHPLPHGKPDTTGRQLGLTLSGEFATEETVAVAKPALIFRQSRQVGSRPVKSETECFLHYKAKVDATLHDEDGGLGSSSREET